MNFGNKKKITFGKPEKRIKDVEPKNYGSTGAQILKKEELKDIIDEPCLRVCEELFDKNIRTIDSGCSKLCPNEAYVVIAYDSLDWRNQMVAQGLIMKKLARFDKGDGSSRAMEDTLRLSVPTTPEDFVSDVSAKLSKLANLFKKQEKMKERNPMRHWDFIYQNQGIKPNPKFLPQDQQEVYRQWLEQNGIKH